MHVRSDMASVIVEFDTDEEIARSWGFNEIRARQSEYLILNSGDYISGDKEDR